MINCKTYDRGHLRQAHLWNTAYIQMSEYKGFPSNEATYISMKHNSNCLPIDYIWKQFIFEQLLRDRSCHLYCSIK